MRPACGYHAPQLGSGQAARRAGGQAHTAISARRTHLQSKRRVLRLGNLRMQFEGLPRRATAERAAAAGSRISSAGTQTMERYCCCLMEE
jgi:hypothetical protein